MVNNVLNFVQRDIWRMPSRRLRGPKGGFVRSIRIVIASFREFTSDQCGLWASALTFYSLLSIVPVFAMAFGVAKGFGLDKTLREKILESAAGQQEIIMRILEFSENMLNNTRGGLIAGAGLALLFWSVIQVLSNIEQAFNHIWGIKKQRGLGQKFSDYLSLMLIVPVFYLIASSATVFLASQVDLILQKVSFLGALGPVIYWLLKLLPLCIFAGLLTYLYIFMPNGKIQFKSALLGGFVAGLIYNIVQWIYVRFQVGVSNAGAVYGTFAALPLFLVWLQLSWRIVLYGAELSFAHQNEDKYEFEEECLKASYEFKKLLALRMAQLCVARFISGQPPLSDQEIAAELEMPLRLARQILEKLVESGVLTQVQTANERERFYQPGRDVSEMTIQSVVSQMETAGGQDVPVAETPELHSLRESLKAFEAALENLPANHRLKDLKPSRSEAHV